MFHHVRGVFSNQPINRLHRRTEDTSTAVDIVPTEPKRRRQSSPLSSCSWSSTDLALECRPSCSIWRNVDRTQCTIKTHFNTCMSRDIGICRWTIMFLRRSALQTRSWSDSDMDSECQQSKALHQCRACYKHNKYDFQAPKRLQTR